MATSKSPRTAIVQVRMTPEDKAMLEAIAEEHGGISLSATVRLLARRAHAEVFGKPRTKKRSTKYVRP
jgi:hypothetical protein